MATILLWLMIDEIVIFIDNLRQYCAGFISLVTSSFLEIKIVKTLVHSEIEDVDAWPEA